ncbi:DEKNAAC105375 [Brettanomyces naardenensis]|uniref:DEKNAAC105376 n=1 Tax=Brettanomyces naardenensis TaxID=13370 RepID=A0A448YTI4_BRENA|nr:DEKNAAC105375 [Brettanomyces naardenensis]
MVTVIESSAALRKKKILKKSLNFTVMVIGQSGTGRSTFINSLCDQLIVEPSSTARMYSPEELGNPDRELQLRKSTVELEDEEGVRINLNLIDTPGFGDSLNNDVSFQIIRDYLKYQFDEILIEESKLRRNPRFKDKRVHVCLYFIVPTGHGLREIDVEVIRTLGEFVNVLPCICKSDSLTAEELRLNKKLIKEDIEYYKLPVFDFTNEYFNVEGTLDDESVELNRYLQKTIPFALMGSNATIKDEITGENKRVRKYPWGVVDIFDNEISDVLTLKTTLLVTHLNDFKDFTHEVLYENYRAKTLSEVENGEYNYSNNNSFAESNNSATDLTRKKLAVAAAAAATRNSNSSFSRNVTNAKSNSIGVTTNGANAAADNSTAASVTASVPGTPDPDIQAKEEQIKLEEERLKAFEQRVQRDLALKREEIEAREKELAEIEKRLAAQDLED